MSQENLTVALLDSIHPAAGEEFRAEGFEVISFPKSIQSADLINLAAEVNIIGVRSGPKITGEMMDGQLEAISVFGVGTNHIERGTEESLGADQKGIAVFNSPHENTRSVAELVMGLTYDAMRRISYHNMSLHGGSWTKEDGTELRGKTMGIIGYGVIGMQVGGLAEANGMDVVAYDPKPGAPQSRTVLKPSIEEVLEVADVVSLHTPLMPTTENLINAKRLKCMKQGSYLINAARAELIDLDALREALDNGMLAGAALDVYDKDPATKGAEFSHPLLGYANVTFTPHIGGSTKEAQSNIGASTARKTIDYVLTGKSTGSVNLPGIDLAPVQPDTSRLLHIHNNVPGVIAKLSGQMAEAQLNVVALEQRAQGEIGYAAIDIEGQIPHDALAIIRGLHATIRSKVITTS